MILTSLGTVMGKECARVARQASSMKHEYRGRPYVELWNVGGVWGRNAARWLPGAKLILVISSVLNYVLRHVH